MIHRFRSFELDENRRELRLRGREIVLQPRVFDLLAYLVRNRERTVSKEELLETLWPGVIVTDSSLQRAMSLARSALRQGGAGEAIRTFSRRGYRFCSEVATGGQGKKGPALPADLVRARQGYDRGEWEAAVDRFRKADRESALGGPDLERWARTAYWTGRAREAIAPLERAVATHSAVGDPQGAARAALLLAQIQFERREVAVATGWHRRAADFLAGGGESAQQGHLELLGSRLAAFDGRLEEALARATRAQEIGKRMGDADLEVLALLYRGLALLSLGEIRLGTELQDEAAAAVLAGQVEPWSGGLVYCGVIWGCRNRGDWIRAAQWTEQFTRWCDQHGMSGFPGTCRLHRAEVLGVGGDLEGAEREIRQSLEVLTEHAPWAEGDAHRVLGDLLLARGDLGGSEAAFQRAHELGWDPEPGHALLLVAQGKADAAVRGLERALGDPGWSNRQRRGLLLAHLAMVAVAAGRTDRARAALAELDDNPALWSTPAIGALVARARGELAAVEGSRREALGWFRKALGAWKEIRSPLNEADLHVRMARVLLADGDPDAAHLDLCAAESILGGAGGAALLRQCREIRGSMKEGDR